MTPLLPARAVFSLRVRVFDNEAWNMGHTWLRVTLADETRDVCAGSVANEPGQVYYEAVLPVLPGHWPTLFLTHLGMILFCGILEWRALLTPRPAPAWAYVPRQVPGERIRPASPWGQA